MLGQSSLQKSELVGIIGAEARCSSCHPTKASKNSKHWKVLFL